jgi:PAS domain S-box-containing protein
MSVIKKKQILLSLIVKEHQPLLTYGFAVLFSSIAIWITELFWPVSNLGQGHTMLPLIAVFMSAVIGGALPGLLATFVTSLALAYFLYPATSLAIADPTDRSWLAIYVVFAVAASWLGAWLKTTLQFRISASLILEEKVKERTSELEKANLDLRRLLNEVQQSQELLDLFFENVPVSVFIKDAQSLRYLRVNKANLQLIGISAGYSGKTDFDLFPPDFAERFIADDRQALVIHKTVDIEEVLPTKEHGMRVMRTKKIPIYGENGQPLYVIGIAEDITELKQREEQRLALVYEQAARGEAERRQSQLEDALQARDTFLSICSHELKTPLTTLKLQTGIIRKFFEERDIQALLSPRVRDLVLENDKEINRINRLIEDMLDVSRIRTGKLSIRPEKVDLPRLIREVVDHFKIDPNFRQTEISTKVPDELTGIWDRHRIEQILTNLISNALKYGQGKPIEISASVHNGNLQLIVEDQGPGIARQDQERIFQRFERAEASDKISGLGLGLYIVKEIVTMHGGTIHIESELNQGSRFVVDLPIEAKSLQKSA